MNKQQEPCLRFNGFSGLWEEKYLDEVGDFSAGGDIKKEKLTPFGRYPVLANALTNNGIVGFYNDYEFESPAITITGRGDVGIAKARKENFSAVVRLLVLKNKPNYDVDFLEQAINKIDFHIESTGVPQLTVPQCRSYSIYLPSESEQTHLGLFFRRLDSQIAESRAVLEKSRQLKKAMLAKMYPANGEKIPKIRFKGFDGEWECRKLGELCTITTGKLDANAMTENGRYDFFTSGIKKYKIDHYAFIGPAITIAGNGATIGYMHYADGYFNAYQRTYVLTGIQANRNFIFSEINQKLQNKIKQESRAGNIPYIVLDMLTELSIDIPTIEEQTAIGNFFRQLDETIALQTAEVEKLNQLKKGLLAAILV